MKKAKRIVFTATLHRKGIVVTQSENYDAEELEEFYDDVASEAVRDFIQSEIPALADCTKFTITAR